MSRKSVYLFGMNRMICLPGGRFPPAWPQPPRRYAPAGSSPHAIPAGVATFHSNQLVFSYEKLNVASKN
ncbi:hypothetical protein HF876_04860 [Psychrobacillus sp. BL-248-WT-3]|nr:hypothetical protein [Psychrobacillus sp. BL-248-WT-3]